MSLEAVEELDAEGREQAAAESLGMVLEESAFTSDSCPRGSLAA